MSRIWNFSRTDGAGGGTDLLPARSPDPYAQPHGYQGPAGPPLDEPDPGDARYVSRPVRPVSQLAVRVALWGAVVLGALGGVVSMVTAATAEDPEAVVPEVDEEAGVPAPVAGTAELVTQVWLMASDDDDEVLGRLFVSPPPLDRAETETLEVLDTKAVAGMRLEQGYWSVTVAARVFETPRADGEADEPLPEVPEPTTWYVEVGIVGEVGDGLKALTTPAIVPPPRMDETPWLPAALPTQSVGSDDRIAATVEDFLNALLAGRGDPGRYLAHNVQIPAVTPAPFASVEVLEMSGITLEDDPKADVRLWVLAQVETAGGSRHVVGYEIRALENIDRWEIVSIWGAPDVEPTGSDEDDDEEESPPTSAGTPAETTVPEATEEGDGTEGGTEGEATEGEATEGEATEGDGTGAGTPTDDGPTTTVDMSGESGGEDEGGTAPPG